MTEQYKAKVFKSGNSVALRLPKALGLRDGDTMELSRNPDGFVAAIVPAPETRISLDGIYGAVPGIQRPKFDENSRDWGKVVRAD